ncbi:hypothetical protein SAICODRAFT_17394 [Saitoella complicata NRRL Y-17804]|uniref:Uncharacterized protein n=1 Tax=Saitoella complicata (strain BCRC 22490 / CBS 7301 / JCM 7358 / NBRC 10748 / NRRL Y-17804) TaxID=698492 RepID=A0A0E9NKG4_SAICN|nr:uncharacterized protein SAICODRAFT_17394 [Saitoella complicata NRRL Y-17804]ODQ54971.1 hypothetical protein SAICODRAFT_17394 [Saitoella complicata NRRL Y-17804]GAO49875.1 hypothetical protein G7K_4012-t1 [Saitoella complicata NRRL Y-17804]
MRHVLNSVKPEPLLPLLASLRRRTQDPTSTSYPVLRQVFSTAIPYGSLVELSGTAGGGKTHLLYLICSIALLPPRWTATDGEVYELGGKGEAVVYIDTDGKLSTLRLREVMSHHLTTAAGSLSLNDRDEAIYQALQRLHIFRPISSTSLLATLRFLPTYVCTPSSSLLDTKIGVVALDSLSAFFWQDRYQAPSSETTPTKPNDHVDTYIFATIAKTLKDFCLTHSCFAICTNWVLFGNNHLPQTWNNAVNLRVRLQKGQMRHYDGMTLAEAWQASQREDSESRREVTVKTELGGRMKLFVDGEGMFTEDQLQDVVQA